jgi:hypothetical protein
MRTLNPRTSQFRNSSQTPAICLPTNASLRIRARRTLEPLRRVVCGSGAADHGVGAVIATIANVRTAAAERCRRRFLRFFPNGFADETYLDWERSYKADAHEAWRDQLNSAPSPT